MARSPAMRPAPGLQVAHGLNTTTPITQASLRGHVGAPTPLGG